MTFRQILALRKRRIEEMRWTELMLSRLTAAVINAGFSRPKESVSQTAFMIHPFEEPVIRRPGEELPGDTLLRLLEQLPPGAALRTNGC